MIVLSILIPTIPERGEQFTSIYNEVHRQIAYMDSVHPSLGHIQVITDASPKFLEGGLSIGKKREALVKRAEGKYLCFLDDDDTISPSYVETLVRMCWFNADVVTFRNLTKLDNFWTIVDMRMGYCNDQVTPEFIVRRRPFHICPVRSEFAKKYPFEDISYGEDFNWMEKVLTHCTTESHTEQVIHEYRHSSKTSEADKIVKNEQSE